MPRIAANTGARVLERLVLQALCGNADGLAVLQQERLVRGDEVRHAPALPHMAMKPEPAIHCVDHPVTSLVELSELQRAARGTIVNHSQPTTPGESAGATGAAVPMNSAQKCGYESGFVEVAAHPVAVASTIVTVLPWDAVKFTESS